MWNTGTSLINCASKGCTLRLLRAAWVTWYRHEFCLTLSCSRNFLHDFFFSVTVTRCFFGSPNVYVFCRQWLCTRLIFWCNVSVCICISKPPTPSPPPPKWSTPCSVQSASVDANISCKIFIRARGLVGLNITGDGLILVTGLKHCHSLKDAKYFLFVCVI